MDRTIKKLKNTTHAFWLYGQNPGNTGMSKRAYTLLEELTSEIVKLQYDNRDLKLKLEVYENESQM